MSEDKIKILCVEDEQDICENIAEILRDEGFEVFEAHNGKSGFESFVKNKPDLIISDIMMPELDGYGLLKMIRENKSIRNHTVPFIFLSALGQKDDVIKGVSLSANDYLVKPIDFELLIAKVKEKTANSVKVKEHHDRDIKNIKDQVSTILPSELSQYIDTISQISAMLRNEPYGPLPHRRYLEDINKIYLSATKLKAIICNALDENVIDSKLNTDEEILPITNFFDAFISGLGDKYQSRIKFDHPYESDSQLSLKIDKLVLVEALKKILILLFNLDSGGSVVISIMINHLDEMIIIFYLKSKIEDFDLSKISCDQINETLDQQSCQFELSLRNGQLNGILTAPSYRTIQVASHS